MFVAGLNDYFQISSTSNNKYRTNKLPLVCPPLKSTIDFSKLISYSTYYWHSAIVKNDGTAYVMGFNGRKSHFESLPQKIADWTRINIEGSEFTSIVCGNKYTLCLLKPNQKYKYSHLACYWNEKNNGAPFHINIQNHVPVALFGGRKTAAAIDDQGNVIIISQSLFEDSSQQEAEIISLPNYEKSIYVACLEKIIFILSENKKIYEYPLTGQTKELKIVKELSEERIISLSGTDSHALVVTDDHRVFGRGSNKSGQLCLSGENSLPSKFVNIPSLNDKNIISVFAGSNHSLFIDNKGKVYSSGNNAKGELLLDKPSKNNFCTPMEALDDKKNFLENAKYCIAGCQLSCVFTIEPPKNSPNQQFKNFATSKPISEPRVDLDFNTNGCSITVLNSSLNDISTSFSTNNSNNPSISNPSSFDPPSVDPSSNSTYSNPISTSSTSTVARSKKKHNHKKINIKEYENIQKISTKIKQLSQDCQNINLDIQELQKNEMNIMQNLNQIGKVINALKNLKNNENIPDTKNINDKKQIQIEDNNNQIPAFFTSSFPPPQKPKPKPKISIQLKNKNEDNSNEIPAFFTSSFPPPQKPKVSVQLKNKNEGLKIETKKKIQSKKEIVKPNETKVCEVQKPESERPKISFTKKVILKIDKK